MNPAHFEPTDFPPEMLLLLFCCYSTSTETQSQNIGAVIQQGINWAEFIQLAHYHQVLPLVYHNLQKHAANNIPPLPLSRLKAKSTKQKIHALKLTAELVYLVKLLAEQGIQVISLKGPLLAQHWYGDISLRHFIDIDLLVAGQDIQKIHALLIQEGYHTAHPEIFSSALHWQVFKNSKHHVPYHHYPKSIELELHFRLFKNAHVFPNHELNAWHRTQTLDYAGVTFNLLEPIDNVLFLLIHGAIHQWQYLKWLVDIAEWSGSPYCDWEKLYQRAQELGLERPVLQGMLLLNHLFQIPLPPFFATLHRGSTVSKLFSHALTVIKKSRAHVKGGFLFACRERIYLWKLKRGLRYKLRYVRDLFYLDSHRHILRLPAFLFPLYIILNPFLWFYKNYLMHRILSPSKLKKETVAKKC